MTIIGKHIILDLYDIDIIKLQNINDNSVNISKWNNMMKEYFTECNINCLNISWHNFDDFGAFTVLYLLAESHLSIHTWPEKKYIAIDVFTCGSSDTEKLANLLVSYFDPLFYNIQNINRGTYINNNMNNNSNITNNDTNNDNDKSSKSFDFLGYIY